jgi:hypothetical protein
MRQFHRTWFDRIEPATSRPDDTAADSYLAGHRSERPRLAVLLAAIVVGTSMLAGAFASDASPAGESSDGEPMAELAATPGTIAPTAFELRDALAAAREAREDYEARFRLGRDDYD